MFMTNDLLGSMASFESATKWLDKMYHLDSQKHYRALANLWTLALQIPKAKSIALPLLNIRDFLPHFAQ